jgi:hypothetical protein
MGKHNRIKSKIKLLLIWLLGLISIVGFVFLSLFIVKTIWQSDLPEWFKIWWIAS